MRAETLALWCVWDGRMRAAWEIIRVASLREGEPRPPCTGARGKPREMGWKVAKMTKMTTMSSMKIKYFTNS